MQSNNSFADDDPSKCGLIINLFIGLILALPLLFIFIRTYHQPNSILWKAVYVPRTWCPPQPSKLTNSINQSQSHLFTDEQIHLCFLALGLTLSLHGLFLGLPLSLTLFIADVPLLATTVRLSSLENLTSLRLLYRFDQNLSRYINKLNLWAVFSLLIGSILAFGLILLEWNYLNAHLRRFSHSKCGNLQIVFLPADPHSGLDQIGEKEMVDWVRACKLGPLGSEGDGLALEAEIRAQRGLFEKAHQQQPQQLGSDTYANLQDHPQPEFAEAGQRGLIIHDVFTISNLNQLCSLSESRRKVLNQLELAEAKYVAGFIPEHEDQSLSKHAKGKGPLWKTIKGKLDEELDTSTLTPYGPSTFYRLETQQPRIVSMSWKSPTLDWGLFEMFGKQSK
ncbi:hypothetical protein CROQUDRAFT_85674 [Cronartium quercuum f. sp. fusiforme G11]|uniref:Uncharacterized protein n=1 Tax=Cronartium quercuum f. sp. fusiforme G11 TaxID=708437 RepID=A0A9P6THI8_9BASI|nr:hypothetical protein CROQUDRAFT_85674 [Cronartium quercuum f. sp. fusiforme G11]